MNKWIVCLAAILVLICSGVSAALSEGGLSTALACDPAWAGYEIIVQAGDYAVVSIPEYNVLVTMDGDGQIAAYPNAVHQPGEEHGGVSLLPLQDREMAGFQLIYDNHDGEYDQWEYFVFDDRVSDNVGDLLLREARIGDLSVYRVDDKPEINLKEHISYFIATYGVVYSDERLERCVQQLIEMSDNVAPDDWINCARPIFLKELSMTLSMVFSDFLMTNTLCDLNAIRWIKSWNDTTNGWDGQARYIVTDGQHIAWYSDNITLSSFCISLFPDSITRARDAFSNAQE